MTSSNIVSGLVTWTIILILACFFASLLYYQQPGSPWNIYKPSVMVKWNGNDGDLSLSVSSHTGYLYARKKVDIGFTFAYKGHRYRVTGYEGLKGDRFVYLFQSNME